MTHTCWFDLYNYILHTIVQTLARLTIDFLIHIQAYKQGIMPPQHIFLTVAWYSDQWWTVDTEGLSCTMEQRERVLLTTLAVRASGFLDVVNDVNLTTDTGIVCIFFFQEASCACPYALCYRLQVSSWHRNNSSFTNLLSIWRTRTCVTLSTAMMPHGHWPTPSTIHWTVSTKVKDCGEVQDCEKC